MLSTGHQGAPTLQIAWRVTAAMLSDNVWMPVANTHRAFGGLGLGVGWSSLPCRTNRSSNPERT